MFKGRDLQYDLSGTFHRGYQQGVVNRRRPNEWSFSIILALDEFKFQYKNDTMEGELETVSVPIRHAAIFFKSVESLWRGKWNR